MDALRALSLSLSLLLSHVQSTLFALTQVGEMNYNTGTGAVVWYPGATLTTFSSVLTLYSPCYRCTDVVLFDVSVHHFPRSCSHLLMPVASLVHFMYMLDEAGQWRWLVGRVLRFRGLQLSKPWYRWVPNQPSLNWDELQVGSSRAEFGYETQLCHYKVSALRRDSSSATLYICLALTSQLADDPAPLFYNLAVIPTCTPV